ncbi:MAG: GNAT family N-acetyltransferase [candidate division Zixibacteria bacterium]|jgi:GNAT superfamily N-acetyltransferase|nr:GNAT family N-acetyltransferase [candidate division Zixibacteria bacterium]
MEYKILRADLAKDGADIVRFWDTQFHGWPVKKFKWFYQDNPAGPGDCWIVREPKDNTIVGSIACFPKQMIIGGTRVMIGLGGDLGVNSEHRRQGLALALRKAMIAHKDVAGYPFLVGTPNANSARITERAGYTIIGGLKRMVKVLHARSYVQRVVKIGALSGLLAKPVDGVMALASKERKYRDNGMYRYEILTEFDGRFDTLSEEGSRQYAMVAARSSRFLNWRFAECPYKSYRVFALSDAKASRLLGYIVFRTSDNDISINDIFTVDNRTVLEPLIGEFILWSRAERIDTLTFFFFGNPAMYAKFEEFGFKMRADDRIKVIVYADQGAPYRELAYSSEQWHFTNGDNDV